MVRPQAPRLHALMHACAGSRGLGAHSRHLYLCTGLWYFWRCARLVSPLTHRTRNFLLLDLGVVPGSNGPKKRTWEIGQDRTRFRIRLYLRSSALNLAVAPSVLSKYLPGMGYQRRMPSVGFSAAPPGRLRRLYMLSRPLRDSCFPSSVPRVQETCLGPEVASVVHFL